MFDELVITILETTPDVVMFLSTFHYDFENHSSQNLIQLMLEFMFLLTCHYDFVYHQYTRSHVTYVIVYVLMNLSLRFCVPPVHKISCDFTHALHVVSDF